MLSSSTCAGVGPGDTARCVIRTRSRPTCRSRRATSRAAKYVRQSWRRNCGGSAPGSIRRARPIGQLDSRPLDREDRHHFVVLATSRQASQSNGPSRLSRSLVGNNRSTASVPPVRRRAGPAQVASGRPAACDATRDARVTASRASSLIDRITVRVPILAPIAAAIAGISSAARRSNTVRHTVT